ncbi:YbaY family lipoprotein [Pseudomonas sp. NPDC077186]|uniref:YbaY family lipoprotein n=1 Tax=Pseudomonas sp. NPDC077186 TaxID=3364421 RepID=UPI0037C7F853
MNLYLPLLALILAGLLGACASEPAAPPAPPPGPPSAAPVAEPRSLLPSLRGQLLGVAAGAEVDLALLAVDARGRPATLLGHLLLRGDGNPLPFALHFEPASFPGDQRVELRGRVTQSGRLVQRLPAQTIAAPQSRDLGPLRLVPAP